MVHFPHVSLPRCRFCGSTGRYGKPTARSSWQSPPFRRFFAPGLRQKKWRVIWSEMVGWCWLLNGWLIIFKSHLELNAFFLVARLGLHELLVEHLLKLGVGTSLQDFSLCGTAQCKGLDTESYGLMDGSHVKDAGVWDETGEKTAYNWRNLQIQQESSDIVREQMISLRFPSWTRSACDVGHLELNWIDPVHANTIGVGYFSCRTSLTQCCERCRASDYMLCLMSPATNNCPFSNDLAWP